MPARIAERGSAWVAALVLAACQKPAPPPEPAPIEQLDEAAVLTRTHSFFQAFDHDDADALKPMLGSAFTKVEQGRFTPGALVLQELRADFGSPPVERKWSEEHVFTAPGTATFVGAATESFTRQDGGPGGQFEFWNTVVWTRAGATWQVALWQIERIKSAKEEWNETYKMGVGFRHEPNQLLVAAVQGREPGTALDVMMGQGRNAVYLAAQGWKVTGVDISDEGIRIAKEEAQKRDLTIDAVEADIDQYDFGAGKWDLITLIYAGADPKIVERIRRALKPNGMVVVEVFNKDGTAGTRSSGFETGELAKLFPGWGTLRDETTEDVSDWGGPNKVKLVRFVAIKPLHYTESDASIPAAPDAAPTATATPDAAPPPVVTAATPDAAAPISSAPRPVADGGTP